MNWSILVYGTSVWGVLLFLAVFNGIFRDQGYSRVVGEQRAQQISTVLLCAIILGVTWLFLYFNRRGDYSTAELLLLGAWWALLMILFEFGFFHYVMRRPWSTLVQNYNVLQGRLTVLVPLTLLLAPALVGALLR